MDKVRETRKRKLIAASLLGIGVLLAGTMGYRFIEGWDLLDALYMTVITLATVGYGEIRTLTPAGRVFTIFVIIFGVGTVAYLAGQMTQAMVEVSVQRVLGRRKLEKQIKSLKDHYILCGYGRIGRMIASEISAKKLPLVVIDNSQTAMEQLERDGLLYVRGDASDEENLLAAGIDRAQGIIAAVSSDADNVYIVLTARTLSRDIFILSRASDEKSLRKLKGAGADHVVSPYSIGARKMAQAILRPAVSDFIETTVHGVGEGDSLAMEEILVTPDSRIKDTTLLESNIRRDMDLIVIAIKTGEGRMLFNPSAQARIQVGDTLIAVGQKNNMDKLAELLGANTSAAPKYALSRRNIT